MKKTVITIVSLVLAALAIGSCLVGCMEFFESKNYFGFDSSIFFVFSLLFSLMVGAFSRQGFSDFFRSIYEKDSKK